MRERACVNSRLHGRQDTSCCETRGLDPLPAGSCLGGVTQAEPQVLAELCARYELEMDPRSVPELIQRFDLQFPGTPI